MTVIGTRPEAIKLAPLVLELGTHPRLRPLVVTTGQHRDLVDEVLVAFGVRADVDLAAGSAGPDLHAVAAAVLSGVGDLLGRRRPAAVVVQGDTTSALSAALAAFYQRVPVAHLEAGLRSGDLGAPFPEEAHRRLAGVLAGLHLAPTPDAVHRLLGEGVPAGRIRLTGNTVVDALHLMRRRRAAFRDRRLAGLPDDGRVLLVTAHRRESWGAPLERVARAVELLALARRDLCVVVSTHPNPVAHKPFARLVALDNVLLVEPEPYASFVRLMGRADVILTDSGGIQEEAPSLGTPVLVLRERTERVEGVRAGAARLVGTRVDRIVAETHRLLDDPAARRRMARARDLYGDGAAASRAVAAIASWLAQPSACISSSSRGATTCW